MAKNNNIERLEREKKARMVTRETLRTKLLTRMTPVQEEANADRGITDERLGHGKVGEKRRVGDERGFFMSFWTRLFISFALCRETLNFTLLIALYVACRWLICLLFSLSRFGRVRSSIAV